MRLAGRVAALSEEQRGAIRTIRIRLDGLRAVASINQSGRGLTYAGDDTAACVDTEDMPRGVRVASWAAWPDIVVDVDPMAAIEEQLAEVLASGAVGEGYVERLSPVGAHGDEPPRWRLVCDGTSPTKGGV